MTRAFRRVFLLWRCPAKQLKKVVADRAHRCPASAHEAAAVATRLATARSLSVENGRVARAGNQSRSVAVKHFGDNKEQHRLGQTRHPALCVYACLLLALIGPAYAQQAQTPAEDRFALAPPAAQDRAAPPPGFNAGDQVQTMDEVKALPPDDEVLDLYRFDNPIKVDANRFSDLYHPPPSPKEISENGGYLLYGLGALVGLAGKVLPKMPGIKGQVQPAIARPPPLNLEQMNRAARVSGQDMPGTDAPVADAIPRD
jgi:hypothetical protein